MSTTLLLLLASVSYSSLFVVAAPIQEGGLIGPEKEESELISAATTCQTAILRCCTPNTPTTDATWRCFEKNSCGGLFVVHTNDTETNITLGACAFLSKIKELVDEEDNNDSTVSVRNGGRPDPEDDDLAKTDTQMEAHRLTLWNRSKSRASRTRSSETQQCRKILPIRNLLPRMVVAEAATRDASKTQRKEVVGPWNSSVKKPTSSVSTTVSTIARAREIIWLKACCFSRVLCCCLLEMQQKKERNYTF